MNGQELRKTSTYQLGLTCGKISMLETKRGGPSKIKTPFKNYKYGKNNFSTVIYLFIIFVFHGVCFISTAHVRNYSGTVEMEHR